METTSAQAPPRSVKAWFVEHGKLIAGAVGVAIALLVITAFVLRTPTDDHMEVHVLWPKRLSVSTDGELVVQAMRHEEAKRHIPLEGAKARLYRVKTKNREPYYGRSYDSYVDGDKLAKLLVKDGAQLKELTSGEFDARGFARLKLPMLDKHEHEAMLGEGASGISFDYILEVDHNGNKRYSAASLGYGVSAAQVAVTLDRPLYQPGQVVKLRALILDADKLQPIAGQLSFKIKDPKSNLVLSEDKVMSAAGIAHTELALAPECVQGVYTLEVHHDNQITTKTFEVQPYRLPRYKVEVVPWTGDVKPGATLKAQVVATYTYGERVKDAKVELVINYTRAGRAASERIEGVTDARGVMEVEWKLPMQVSQGSQITMRASVSTDTGRAEEGQGVAKVSGRLAKFELMPLGTPSFVYNKANQGVVMIKDQYGAPVEGAQVVMFLPEAAQKEREVKLTTDAKGLASFSWTPSDYRSQVAVELTLPGQAVQRQTYSPPMMHGAHPFVNTPSVATLGEPFAVEVSAANPGMVVVFRQGLPLLATPIQGKATLELPQTARGLIYLVFVDEHGQHSGVYPVVVRHRSDGEVKMALDKAIYEPGSAAKLELSFAATDGSAQAPSQDKPPVTYGVVGVDEALYALKERTDEPLAAMMRQDPAAVGELLSALAKVDEASPTSKIETLLATTQLQRSLSAGSPEQLEGQVLNRGRDISYDIARQQMKQRASWWALFISLLLISGALFAARLTWRQFSKQSFSFKRLGLFVLVSVACLPVVIALSGIGQERSIMGGALVWGLVLGGWLLGAAWRDSSFALGRWFAALLGMSLLTGLFAAAAGSAGRLDDSIEMIVMVCSGAALALMAIQAMLWPFILVERGHKHAGYGLATLFGAALFIPVMMTAGRRYEAMPSMMQMAKGGNMAMEERFASLTPATEAPADSDDMPMPAKPDDPGEPGAKGPRVRAYFPETMVWVPELSSDAKGGAQVMIEVPDSITTWRLNAWAHTWDGRFGQGQHPLKVRKDFFVEVELPTTLIQGDRAILPVTLINQREVEVKATLSAKTLGGLELLAGAAAQEITLAPGQRQSVNVRVMASAVGRAELTVSASLNDQGDGDAVMRPVQILPDGRQLTESRAGIIDGGFSAMVSLPPDMIAGTGALELKLFPSPIADALDGLEGMLRLPTGCFEQTSSSNYPNVLIAQALGDISPEKWPGGAVAHAEARQKALKLLSLGYQRVLSFQRGDGGFALYPDYASSDLMLTAYGVIQLMELSKVYPVDPQVIARATSYLAQAQRDDGTWPVASTRAGGASYNQGADIGQLRTTSFITMALLSSPQAKDYSAKIDLALKHVMARYKNANDANALAFSASALLMASKQDDARKLAAAMMTMVKVDDQQAYLPSTYPTWMGGYASYADIETTAIATAVLLETKSHGDLLPKMLGYLAQHRSPYGGWGSTQATIWTLRALFKVATMSKEELQVIVKADGEAMKHAQGREEPGLAQVGPAQVTLKHFIDRQATAGVHKLEVKPSQGNSGAMLQGIASYAVPWSSPRALVEDEQLGLKLTTLKRASFGEKVDVSAVVTNRTPRELGAIIVELPLPPGSYAPKEQFELLQEARMIDRFEILPTHVRFYLSGINQGGQLDLSYSFVPLLRGQFSLPAGKAYVFYAPEPMTEVNSGDLEVQ